MRITFLMPPDDLTGGNRVVATYARLLAARGHAVTVISNRHPSPGLREVLRHVRHGRWRALMAGWRPSPGHIAQSGVPHHILDRHREITAADVPDADVVVATWWETAVWMDRLPPAKGRKVHLIQGYEIWGGEATRDKVHAALRLNNRKIAISTGLKRDIEAALGDLGIRVVSNAVDLDQFAAPPRPRSDPPTVGFIYAEAGIKGADRCLRAIALAREQIPGLRVVSFGADRPGPALPLPAGCDFVHRPPQAEIARRYARCDAWLFPSRLDSFGLPILEAMACRTPVIGVPIGAAPDLLSDGHGILLRDGSEEEIVRQMALAIVDIARLAPASWRSLSDRAWRRASGYSWNDATELLEANLVATAA